MNPAYNVIQYFIGFFEIYMCFKVLEKIGNKVFITNGKKVAILIVTAGLAMVEVYNRNIRLYSIILIIFLIICISITITLLYSQRFSYIIIYVSFYYFSLALLDLFIIFIMGIALNRSDVGLYIGRNLCKERLIALIIARALLFALYILFWKIKKLELFRFWKIILFILSMQIIGVIYFQEIYARGIITQKVLEYFDFLIIYILTYITFEIKVIYRNVIEENKLGRLRTNMLEQSYNEMKMYFNDSRIFFHDYKAHLILLKKYLSEGEYDKAQNHIEHMSQPVAKLEKRIDTGNEVIDLVINYKVTEAIGKGIDIECDFLPFDLSFIRIKEEELFVILYNLLDNAIEACEKVSRNKRWIYICIRPINEMLLIKVKNSIQAQPLYEKGKFNTIKGDKQYHGIGLSSAKDVVEECGGHLDITFNNTYFEVNITLL